MTASEYAELYRLLLLACSHKPGSEAQHEGDWFVLMAAREVAARCELELTYSPEKYAPEKVTA